MSMDVKPLDTSHRLPFHRSPWGPTLLLASAVLLARILYLVWLCPYELAADEAHYWEWSRRLNLSYYTKGPGVAWLIHASTALFGISEWAVRLPAAVASFACVILLAALAASGAPVPARPRMALLAASLFMLAPVFHGTAQFMTIDGPFYACWVLAALMAWRLHRGSRSLFNFLLLGLIIGLGMLFKYTMLLFVPGTLWFLLRRHPMPPLRRILAILALLTGILICASPILIWNSLNGWPTVAHLLGHAGLPGGDLHPNSRWVYNPLWTLGYLAYPFIVLGPPIGMLLVLSIRDAWRHRLQNPDRWTFASFALHTAIPLLVFYLLLSLKTDIELNWAVAGYTVLMIPAAWYLNDRLTHSQAPERLWMITVGFGIAMALLISFGKWPMQRLSQLDIAGYHIPADRALHRVTGNREIAQRVAKLTRALERETGLKPFIVAAGYSRASLLAFYMPDHPGVHCASALMGGRETAYDYFLDANLSDPGLLGKPAILVGGTSSDWDQALYFKTIIRSAFPGRLFAAYDYGGTTREH
jgi:4-amino-4-deoxy-L-arabinose transferase-like glycosyltransferase